MLRKLYDWVVAWAGHRRAEWGLAGISVAESSFFPIPPDVLMIPMCFSQPTKAWRYALITTLASVFGGMIGYLLGAQFYDIIGKPLLSAYGYQDKFDTFQQVFSEWGWWIVIGAGFTPFPYKVITVSAGLTGLSFPIFMAASVIGRGARFFLLALLFWWIGPKIKPFIEQNLAWVTTAGFILLIGGFALIKLLA